MNNKNFSFLNRSKLVFMIMVITMLSIIITSCGQPDFKEITKEELNELSSEKQIQKQLDKEFGKNGIKDLSKEELKNVKSAFTKIMTSFEYEIIEEKIKDKEAQVTVEIKTKKYGEEFKNTILKNTEELVKNILTGKFKTEDEAIKSVVQKITQSFTDTAKNAKGQYKDKLVFVYKEKDGEWQLEETEKFNSKAIEVLTGGLISDNYDIEKILGEAGLK